MPIKFKNVSPCLDSESFNAKAKKAIQAHNSKDSRFLLVSLDFDNFNFINDLFGYEIGNTVLDRLTDYFSKQLKEEELFAHLNADHYAFLVKETPQLDIVKRFCYLSDIRKVVTDILPSHYNFVCSGGIVSTDGANETFTTLLDKADFARKCAKGNHVNTFLKFDEQMSKELEWKKLITLMMEAALEEHEFEMYLQPKMLMKTEQIAGAEALVRWNSKEYGMIYPDQFIPILEQNGFVKRLDFFMLEQVCLFLKKMMQDGITPLPISVNFSKAHIGSENFVEEIFSMVNSYGISTKLIEIEFTENIFSHDFETLVEITSALKYLGFKVSLDDFGKDYSSLNYLKDLPLDIIKIDKGFLNSSANTDKGRMIIAKMVELIKSLRLVSVVEGVETNDQIKFLQKLGCDLVQGYFYAKPMSAANYIEFVKKNSPIIELDKHLMTQTKKANQSYLCEIPQEFQMDNWELYILGKNIDMGLMKGYLDNEATVQYVNDRALGYLGYTRQEFKEIFNNSILAFTHPEDAEIVQKNIKELVEFGTPQEFMTRAIRKDGKVIMLQGRASCVVDNAGRHIGIYAFQDVTEKIEKQEAMERSLQDKIELLEKTIDSERKSREALRIREECYRLIVEQSDDIMFEWDFDKDTAEFSDKYEKVFGMKAIQDHICSNPAIRERIFTEDLPIFEKWISDTYKKSGKSECAYRLQVSDGSYTQIKICSTAICDENGIPIKAVGIFTKLERS
ncbi:MAG: EAL domain-containing protein [Christensenellaceae bacterium]